MTTFPSQIITHPLDDPRAPYYPVTSPARYHALLAAPLRQTGPANHPAIQQAKLSDGGLQGGPTYRYRAKIFFWLEKAPHA